MKRIDLKIGLTAEIKVDPSKVDPRLADKNGIQRLAQHDLVAARDLVDVARQNGADVVWSAIEIEKSLEMIISMHMFFPLGMNPSRQFFNEEILKSSFFGFAPKKELVKKILNERELLAGKSKNRLGGYLKKIMTARNAFAHGNIVARQDQECFLHYFSGSQKEVHLTEKYWDELETAVLGAKNLLKIASDTLGVKLIKQRQDELGK